MNNIVKVITFAFSLVIIAACGSPDHSGGTGTLEYTVVKSSGVNLTAAELQMSPSSGAGISVDLLDALQTQNSIGGIVSLEAGITMVQAGFISDGREVKKTYMIRIEPGKTSQLEILLIDSDFVPFEKLWVHGSAVSPAGNALEMTRSGNTFRWAGSLQAGSFRILADIHNPSPVTSSTFMPAVNGTLAGDTEQPMMYSPGIVGRGDAQWSISQPGYYRITVYPMTMTIRIQTVSAQTTHGRAPMYWTVYEYHREREVEPGFDPNNNFIPESVFKQNIDWVAEHLLPYGFDMVCVDGWGGGGYIPTNINGYRTTHSVSWVHDYAYWSAYLQDKGMSLGMYWNPLWVDHVSAVSGKMIWNTNIPISAVYDINDVSEWGFRWVQVDRPGAEEYIKGCVKYYADMGVTFLRVDFLSWYETGFDHNMGNVSRTDRPRGHYETALRWMREACDEYGVYLSLVMPNLVNEAEHEKVYGHMYRINGDTFEGGWRRLSRDNRGERRFDIWPQFENPFDGFVYWSQFVEEGTAIMDGDFLRLNTFTDDEQRMTAVSLMVMAGSPIAAADRIDSEKYNAADMLPFYQNDTLMALAREGFRGRPLTHDYSIAATDNQIWIGQAANGDWIVGLFNREDTDQTRSIHFADRLGITSGRVVNIWTNSNEGIRSELSVNVPARACRIFRISEES